MAYFPISNWRSATARTDCYFLVLALLFTFSRLSFAGSESEAEHIFSLINARLGYMEQVALYKHQSHIQVEDLAREKFILDKSLLSATEQGLDSESISSFFQSQMDAAKAIQYRYRAEWLATPPTGTETVDLKNDIRPKLISIGKEIVASISSYLKLGQSFSSSQQAAFMDALKVNNLSTTDKANIFRGLLQVRFGNKLSNN